jgi:SAM-dependent methyltransferase
MTGISKREAEFYDRYWQRTEEQQHHGQLQIPGVHSLEGAKVLICSCGSGKEPVLAAKAGADVYTFDISSVAVEKALAVARFNDVSIRAGVMDFHKLGYPDAFFDYIYGNAILHHVDCEISGREIYRCLKPDGIAYFLENSDRNPILRYMRRVMFGSPDGYQKRRFLAFTRHGTTDEYPLTEEEVEILSDIFQGQIKRIYTNFVFFKLLATSGWKNKTFKELMRGLDNTIVWLFPFVMQYSFTQGIWLQKKGEA